MPMEERFTKLRAALFIHRPLPFFEGIGDYIRTRKPGDQLIFVVLGILIAISSIAGLLALERSILITEPVYGGSLTEGDVGSPRFINPLLALSDTDQDLTTLTYAGLMGIGANGTLVPVLAQSYIVSPDGKTYQFTLRSNLKFSDGSPITADDVVFTVQKAQDLALKSPQYSNWSGVQVTEVDTHTVQFTLAAPYAPFLYNTTLGILPAHLWRNITDDEFPFSNLETTPVGDGPFITTNVTRDSNGAITSYDLAANPDYALGRPYLDSLHFIFYSDQPSLQTAFAKGQVESAYGVISKHVITAPYSRVFAVFFNPNEASFSKLDVREALSEAIDRNAIVHNLLGGYGTPLNGPIPPGSGIAVASSTSSGDGLSAARGLLTKSGWKLSTDGSWINTSGQTLSIALKTSNVPELKVLAEAIQADWKQLGVQTSLQLYEPGDLTQNVIRPRTYEALLFGMVVGKGDDLYDFWDSKESADPGLNITSYDNPAVDALLTKLRSETDPSTRAQDLTTLNQDISADYPAAFIEAPDFVYSVPNDLKGVILPQITAPSDRFATVAMWYRRTESVWPFLVRGSKNN